MFVYEGIAGLVLFLAAAVLSIYFYGRMCRDSGYDEGRADAYTEILTERVPDPDDPEAVIEQPRESAGRHRMSQPRASAPVPPEPDAPAPPAEKPPWSTELPLPPWRMQIPGPGRPQAARTSGPGTAILPRFGSVACVLEVAGVSPRLGLPATTGEMAAITDDYIAGMQAEEDAYRQGLAS